MQKNPIQQLPQQFQAIAQGLVENVLSVVRLFAEVDPGTAEDEEAAARLYVEEVMVDVAQAMAHGRQQAVPKILARVDARRARIRIRAKAESRKAMKSAILVGAGALADFLTHGIGSPIARGILALQEVAAPAIDDEEELEEFTALHPAPQVEPEPLAEAESEGENSAQPNGEVDAGFPAGGAQGGVSGGAGEDIEPDTGGDTEADIEGENSSEPVATTEARGNLSVPQDPKPEA